MTAKSVRRMPYNGEATLRGCGNTCPVRAGQQISTFARYVSGLPVLSGQDSRLTFLPFRQAVCGLGCQAGTLLRGVAFAVFQTFILPSMGGSQFAAFPQVDNLMYQFSTLAVFFLFGAHRRCSYFLKCLKITCRLYKIINVSIQRHKRSSRNTSNGVAILFSSHHH